MARRLLTAGLVLAALAWCGRAAAKPPDLPLENKDVLAPQDPLVSTETVAPAQPNPFPQDADGGQLAPRAASDDGGQLAPRVASDSRSESPTMEAPFFLIRPSARRRMASCLLFGVHPLLALTPPSEVYADFDDDDDPNQRVVELLNQSENLRQIADEWERFWFINQPSAEEEAPTGVLTISLGFNSDAGLTGSIELTGPGIDAMLYGEMLKACWQMIPRLADLTQPQEEERERCTGYHLEQSDEGAPEAPVQPEPILAPKEASSDDSAESVCPWMRQQHGVPCQETVTAEELKNGVLHNLEALSQAQTLLQTAHDFIRSGRDGEALSCLELAHDLCPGSRLDDAVEEAAVSLFAPLYYGSSSSDFGAAEESEPPLILNDGPHLRKTEKEKEGEIERKLKQPVSVDFRDVPLREVIDDLRSWQGINIYVDTAALEAEEVSLDRPISIKLEDVSLKSTLLLVLRQVHLTYVVKDEVLQITTERGARGKMQRVVYAVADLLENDLPCPDASAETTKQAPEKALMNLIATTICPQEWSDNGGPGILAFHPLTRSLVVCATADVQEQIVDLLNALQRRNDADKEEERQDDGPCEGCKTLLNACHEAMDAGRQCEAAALAAKAYALDPDQAASDPLVYKMHLAGDDEVAPAITPCLPPVDPETPAALDQLYQESLRSAPAIGEEEEPPAAAPQGSFEFGFGLDGSVQMFGQFWRGGAIWHVFFGRSGLAVWASPDGGADPAPAPEQTSDFDWDY